MEARVGVEPTYKGFADPSRALILLPRADEFLYALFLLSPRERFLVNVFGRLSRGYFSHKRIQATPILIPIYDAIDELPQLLGIRILVCCFAYCSLFIHSFSLRISLWLSTLKSRVFFIPIGQLHCLSSKRMEAVAQELNPAICDERMAPGTRHVLRHQ